MIQFDAAPAIPADYDRLRALTTEEIELARSAGYVADASDPREPVRREGLDNLYEYPGDDIADWRIRTYMVWFCYIYENWLVIRKPRTAIEELVFEFKAPIILDLPDRRIATLYAGAGAADADPRYADNLKKHIEYLKPHYDKAVRLLEQFEQEHNV